MRLFLLFMLKLIKVLKAFSGPYRLKSNQLWRDTDIVSDDGMNDRWRGVTHSFFQIFTNPILAELFNFKNDTVLNLIILSTFFLSIYGCRYDLKNETTSMSDQKIVGKKVQIESKTHKRLKDGTGQNVHIFEESLFFKLRTIQLKTVKPTYLCPLDAS